MAQDHLQPPKAVINWLYTGCGMIFLMVVIGGITRLTGSGLSMVQWSLVMGSIPPLNEAQWQEAFRQYQQFPEYKIMNSDMTLAGFKRIFFWEYLHRMWGRLLGAVFIVPFLYFLYKKMIPRQLLPALIVMLVLGALQGGVGWFMVKSGLVDKPWVSPYRLSLHLLLALGLYAYIEWVILRHNTSRTSATYNRKIPALSTGLLSLVTLQIFYGGLMAGKKAALFYPTYPDMNGAVIPNSSLWTLDPGWRNLFENPAIIQVIHRNLPLLIGVVLIALWVVVRRQNHFPGIRRDIKLTASVYIVQFLLGIITLIGSKGHVPVALAVLHQAMAVIMLTFVVRLHFYTRQLLSRGSPAA